MDTIIVNDIKFYNLRKLAEAKRVAGDDFEAVVAHYDKLAGKYEPMEKKPAKKVTKKTTKKTTKKRATKKTA